jgi:hypothetical protein
MCNRGIDIDTYTDTQIEIETSNKKELSIVKLCIDRYHGIYIVSVSISNSPNRQI